MDTPYTIKVAETAIEELRSLPDYIRSTVISTIDSLAHNPRPKGAKALYTGHYALPVGRYRLLYGVEDSENQIRVYRVISASYATERR